MTEDANLTNTRQELKRRLEASEFKSSIDVILAWVGRVLQKLTRRKKPPASWISALAVGLVVSLIAYVSSLATGGVSRYGHRTIAIGGALIFLNLVIATTAFGRTIATRPPRIGQGQSACSRRR